MARMQDRIAKHHYRLERRMKNLQEGPEDIQKHLDRRMQEHIAFLSAIESGQVPMPTYLGKVRGHAAKHKVHIQVIRNR